VVVVVVVEEEEVAVVFGVFGVLVVLSLKEHGGLGAGVATGVESIDPSKIVGQGAGAVQVRVQE
jgi:hypothetical protein